MKNARFIILSFLAITVCSCTKPATDVCKDASISITVYADANYKGVSQTFGEGVYFVKDLNIVGNDKISSFKISAPGCMKVRMCEHQDASSFGICKDYTEDNAFLEDLNDKVSYIQVQRN